MQRIEALRGEVERLQGRLQQTKTEAPSGTQGLAQGDDEVDLQITFDYIGHESTETVAPTWDALLATLGPAMLDEASERRLRILLTGLLERYVTKRPKGEPEVEHDSLMQVVSQFRALGLTKLSERKRSASDRETYWTLTDYGQTQVTRLRAIRKGPARATD